jgi:hypothetical protein
VFFSISLTVIFEGEFHSLVREEVFIAVCIAVVLSPSVVVIVAAAAAAVLVVASRSVVT